MPQETMKLRSNGVPWQKGYYNLNLKIPRASAGSASEWNRLGIVPSHIPTEKYFVDTKDQAKYSNFGANINSTDASRPFVVYIEQPYSKYDNLGGIGYNPPMQRG